MSGQAEHDARASDPKAAAIRWCLQRRATWSRGPCRCCCSTCGSMAFYLQYRNVKADYVKAWWNVANWADVARRFATARESTRALIAS